MLKFEHFWKFIVHLKCTPFTFLNTPLLKEQWWWLMMTMMMMRVMWGGLGIPTEHPQDSWSYFVSSKLFPELPPRRQLDGGWFDGSRVFVYGYFICQPLITAYSVNTSFIDCVGLYAVWVFRTNRLFPSCVVSYWFVILFSLYSVKASVVVKELNSSEINWKRCRLNVGLVGLLESELSRILMRGRQHFKR